MLAQRQRFVRLDDAITAATFAHLEANGQQRVNVEVQLMMAGPGVPIRWIDAQPERIRKAAADCEREADETAARLAKELGVPFTGKMVEVPAAAFQRRMRNERNHP